MPVKILYLGYIIKKVKKKIKVQNVCKLFGVQKIRNDNIWGKIRIASAGIRTPPNSFEGKRK